LDSYAAGALLAFLVIPVFVLIRPNPESFFNILKISLGWYLLLLGNAWLAWTLVSDLGRLLICIGFVWSTAIFAGGLLRDLIIRLARYKRSPRNPL
jgi:hypothetical protein